MIHNHYLKLTRKEKETVDVAFAAVFKVFNTAKVPLSGDDRAERAVEALAIAVIDSRDLKPGKSIGGKRTVITRSSIEAALGNPVKPVKVKNADSFPDLLSSGLIEEG